MNAVPSNAPINSETTRTLATQALRLGWLAAELLGLLRQGALEQAAMHVNQKKRPKYRQGRLTISDRPVDDLEDELTLNLAEFSALAEALGVLDIRNTSHPLSGVLNHIRVHLNDPKHTEPVDLGAARFALEEWSLETGGRLSARDALAGRAFGAGASIADTYWFMRLPSEGDAPPVRGETWKRLLDSRRMEQEAVRIQELDPVLSPFLAPALAFSLRAWGIAELFESFLQPTTTVSGAVSEPPPDATATMHKALRRQARNWRRLILGEVLPTNLLTRRNRRWRTVVHWLTWIGMEAVLVGGSFAGLVWAVQAGGPAIWSDAWTRVIALQPAAQAPSLELKDIITSVALLGPVVVVVWNGAKGLVAVSHRLFDWTDRTITQAYVNRAVLVPWNRQRR